MVYRCNTRVSAVPKISCYAMPTSVCKFCHLLSFREHVFLLMECSGLHPHQLTIWAHLYCRFIPGHSAGMQGWPAEHAMLRGQRHPHRHPPCCSPCSCVLCTHLCPAHAQAESPQANALFSCQKRHCLLHSAGIQSAVLGLACVLHTSVKLHEVLLALLYLWLSSSCTVLSNY